MTPAFFQNKIPDFKSCHHTHQDNRPRHYLPDRVVTNDDLAKIMDTTDAWIQDRNGIQEPRNGAKHD